MMLGKRGRPTFRRTTSMTGISFDVEAPPPPPLGHGGVYDHMMLSPRYFRRNDSSGDAETADFLRICGLCNRRLAPGRDIYMYRYLLVFTLNFFPTSTTPPPPPPPPPPHA
ncbi:UNVERIFIED_CONTAM: hypothetical protein Sradi_0824500 [Sesamum radiatum]|uniref:FLZ-type domain-containing protein n=1 Tax=Sesamum radiatum TaxID=300843 RepID=A0AAW2VV39_SESRA